jgi:hypothetical protein
MMRALSSKKNHDTCLLVHPLLSKFDKKSYDIFLELWTALYSKEGAVKQVTHQLVSEALSGRRKSSLRLFQRISGLLIVCIIAGTALITQARPHKTLSPLLVNAVAFDTDDKIVYDDADACPHDDQFVTFGVDELDSNLLQRLESAL